MNKPRLLAAFLAAGIAVPAGSQIAAPVEKCDPSNAHCIPIIAFTSTRDANGEIYLMTTNEDGTVINTRDLIRVTDNDVGDGFPQLSPDGKKIVFDSNRDVPGQPNNISDLFLMKADGNDQRRLTRGSSATWSPDGKYIAFHRSASGVGEPIKDDPGAATRDSDIFVMRVPPRQRPHRRGRDHKHHEQSGPYRRRPELVAGWAQDCVHAARRQRQ